MAHTALARRYRPRRFAEVATQEHVSETLRRAVAGERVGHAYLFSGPRGVGKTTLARVLAMALNCPDRSQDGEPCGECESCTRIWAGTTSLDVVEIDAASNRGVDDARELRSRAMYAPSEEGRFKVYIVDEAHMLTREAWNALLKVLEEPPARVIFIFATTEPEKIEQTAAPILSRCQRFDFRRVSVPEIVARLGQVLTSEGADAPDDALRLIARKADGGMRDALSLTDQVLALSDGTGVSLETVRRLLGVVEEERFLQTMDLLARQDRAGLFHLVEELLDQGYDLVEYYHGLVEAVRTLLRLKVGGSLPELPEEKRQDWHRRAEPFSAADLVRMLQTSAELETGGSLRRSSRPRVLVELLLLRLSYLDRSVEMEALLEALGGHASQPDPAPRTPPGQASPAGAAPTPPPEVQAAGTEPGGTSPPPSPTSEAAAGSEDGDVARDAASEEPPSPDELRAAWRAFLQSGEGIPAGLTPFLLGARVSGAEGGVLTLEVPPGPGLDRLAEPAQRKGLEKGLQDRVTGPVTLRVQEASPEPTAEESRISQEEVREGRLGDLLEKEPGLREAVEQWDLEIMD